MYRPLAMLVAAALSLNACTRQRPVETLSEKVVVAPQDPVQRAEAVRQLLENFSRVHFETDSSSLDGGGKAALEANATILNRYPDLRVEIQGHADERGTIDYNLSLGQRRANAVVGYLSSLGVSSVRLMVVSFGEERPLEQGAGEVAWAQNRRAEFRVIGAPENIQGTVQ